MIDRIGQSEMPIVLTAPLTLKYGPTGSDTTGTGTVAAPFRNPWRAYQYLDQNYDLNNQSVLIDSTAPCSVSGSLAATGRLRGQSDVPTQITIRGAAPTDINRPWSLDPESCNAFKWNAGTGGNCVTATYGAKLTVEGFLFDKKDAVAASVANAGGILVNVGVWSEIWLGTVAVGYDAWPGAAFNAQSNGRLQFRGSLGLFHPVAIANATALDSNSLWITLASLPVDFPLLPQCGVSGNGLPDQCWIEEINGLSIRLNKKPNISAGTMPLTFSIGCTSLVGIGDGSRLYHEIGGINGRGFITATGRPHYLAGPLHTSDGAMNWSGVHWFQRETLAPWTVTFSGSKGSNIIAVSRTDTYGINYSIYTVLDDPANPSLPPNTKVTAINGNQVTLSNVLYRDVTSEPARFGYQAFQMFGPKVTCWNQGGIFTTGYTSMIPGTDPVFQETNAIGSVSQGARFN
jgi:hypothetical protein